jgi:non-homologous end joining protein Ku
MAQSPLSTLRFADELVEVATLKLPKRTPEKKKELDMATSLVESLANDWNPENYNRRLPR